MTEMPKILFLDQSGRLGGAELCLLDIAKFYSDRSLVGLFADGDFRQLLEQQQIPVQVLSDRAINVRKDSSFLRGLESFTQLAPLMNQAAKLSHEFSLIYANTQKALVVGSIASLLSRRPFVYHLHDIISSEHFSSTNRRLIVWLANQFATQVITNSEASKTAFIKAGGREEIVSVVYNGFDPQQYQVDEQSCVDRKQELELIDRFVVGHFSRLSPWKGQHILIEALQYCPEDVTAILVGDALFGEQDYVKQLHQQVAQLELGDRVQFLGFRSDIAPLMSACDLIAHTSTAPEPFGRVIVEGILCGRPVTAAAAGGAIELVEHGVTGWLCPPSDPRKLAEIICTCRNDSAQAEAIAHQGKQQAIERFNLKTTNEAIDRILSKVCT